MSNVRREILSQVAAGTITAQEGAARLDALEAELAGAADNQAAPPAAAPSAPTSVIRRIKVVSQIGSAEVIGDPSVAFVVADGPHRARQDGDMMIIEHAPFDESDHFTFRGGGRRVIINGADVQRRKVTVRMNPNLALIASVQAGSVRIDGVHGPIEGEVQAGNCKISDFRSPLNLVIQAGNLTASGLLAGGASKIRCEMGSVKIDLQKGSSVRAPARATLGKVSIEGEGSEFVNLGQSGKDVTIGSGAGTLDIECTMGNVRVSANGS